MYIGIEGLKSAYERLYANALPREEALFTYTHRDEHAAVSDRFYMQMLKMFKKKKLAFRAICNKDYRKSPYVKHSKDITNFKFIVQPLPGNIDIFNDSILQISWGEKPTGVLIHSAAIAEDYRTYFNQLWN